MTAATRVFEDPVQLGAVLAAEILDGLGTAAAAGRRFLLGCPGGRSLRTTYAALTRLAAERDADLRPLVVVMMDEYVDHIGSRPQAAPPEAHYSCRGFAQREILGPLRAAVTVGHRPNDDALWVPDPEDPGRYDGRIAEDGGIDLFLLASGSGDGHVAFNPPGTPSETTTRVVSLPASTRRDNLATFPDFASLSQVPRAGVTVGLATITRWSHRAVLVCHGTDKRTAFHRLTATTVFDPDWPASIVHACAQASVYADRAAAGRPTTPPAPTATSYGGSR